MVRFKKPKLKLGGAFYSPPIGVEVKSVFSPPHTKNALAVQAALGLSSIEATRPARQTAMVEVKEEQELIETMLYETGHYKLSFTSPEDNSIVVQHGISNVDYPVVHLPPSVFGTVTYKALGGIRKAIEEYREHKASQAPSYTWIKPESIFTFQPDDSFQNDW